MGHTWHSIQGSGDRQAEWSITKDSVWRHPSRRAVRLAENIRSNPVFWDESVTSASRTVFDWVRFHRRFQRRRNPDSSFEQNWHVDCNLIAAERGGRAPKLQTPIGVESARLGAFSLKVRRLSDGVCCSHEALAACPLVESAFVINQVALQRGVSRNLECVQQTSAPFQCGPARGHSFALRGD